MTVEPVAMWILGTGTTVVISGVIGYIKLTERITRVESVLSLFGAKAARLLHSPHREELDRLLEAYIAGHYELSDDDWSRLAEMAEEIENDKSATTETKLLAGMVSALATHKLTRSGGRKKVVEKESKPEQGSGT